MTVVREVCSFHYGFIDHDLTILLEYQPREYTPRRDVPLPTEPPFTAHMGNLPFDLGDEDVASFFTESKVKSVRILKDRDERPKGFGYVEFDDLESLKNAIKLSGESLGGRTVRISVAEPRT